MKPTGLRTQDGTAVLDIGGGGGGGDGDTACAHGADVRDHDGGTACVRGADVRDDDGGTVRTRRAPAAAPRPRADALRNRERIVTAARELFVVRGSSVPLDEVARRAGVGNATLYRHFPDRAALIHQVVLSVMSRIAGRAEEAAAAEADPFEAVRRFVHAAADERIGALCPMLSDSFDHDRPELHAGHHALERAVDGLIERAQTAGRMRSDVAVGDVMVALAQLTRPLHDHACMDVDRFVHRHLQLFLDGLEAPARSELPGRAVTLEDLRAPMTD